MRWDSRGWFENKSRGTNIATRASLGQIAGLLFLAVWLVASGLVAQDIPPSGSGWSVPERWAWEEIRAGRIADFNTREGKLEPLDPRKPDGWGDKRKLSPEFLKEILFREPYRSATPIEGARIIGAWFSEPVDLAFGRLDHQLWLDKCRFEEAADLTNLHVDGWLSLEGSALAGQGDDLLSLSLAAAKAQGFIMTGATVAGTLDMDSLEVGQSLFMSGPDAAFQDVDLRGAKVGGQLDMSSAHVAGTLNMDSLEVGQSLFMSGPDAAFQDVVLRSAKVGDQLNMVGAHVAGTLDMDSVEVGQNLLMRNAAFQDVHLRRAKVGGQLDMGSAHVAGTLNMDSLEVGQSLFMPNAMLDDRADLIFAHIGGLDLSGANLTELDLSATRIEGELRLAPDWREGAHLILRNTHVGGLQAKHLSSWPDMGRLQLDGFTYDRLGGYEGAFTAPNDIDYYIDWLARDPTYTPQPYEHLAAVLRAAGEPTKANRIRYESRERDRAEAWKQNDYARWFGLTLLKWSIGYGLGLRSFLALGWIVFITLIGTAVLLSFSHKPRGVFPKVFFSLDRLLPIVQLDEGHNTVEAALKRGVKYYFYAHKVVGWVLASFLIAALAGLTQN